MLRPSLSRLLRNPLRLLSLGLDHSGISKFAKLSDDPMPERSCHVAIESDERRRVRHREAHVSKAKKPEIPELRTVG